MANGHKTQKLKFSNKNDLLCAWRNFKKNLVGICKYDKWNFKPYKSSIFHFEYVNEVWISDVLGVKGSCWPISFPFSFFLQTLRNKQDFVKHEENCRLARLVRSPLTFFGPLKREWRPYKGQLQLFTAKGICGVLRYFCLEFKTLRNKQDFVKHKENCRLAIGLSGHHWCSLVPSNENEGRLKASCSFSRPWAFVEF